VRASRRGRASPGTSRSPRPSRSRTPIVTRPDATRSAFHARPEALRPGDPVVVGLGYWASEQLLRVRDRRICSTLCSPPNGPSASSTRSRRWSGPSMSTCARGRNADRPRHVHRDLRRRLRPRARLPATSPASLRRTERRVRAGQMGPREPRLLVAHPLAGDRDRRPLPRRTGRARPGRLLVQLQRHGRRVVRRGDRRCRRVEGRHPDRRPRSVLSGTPRGLDRPLRRRSGGARRSPGAAQRVPTATTPMGPRVARVRGGPAAGGVAFRRAVPRASPGHVPLDRLHDPAVPPRAAAAAVPLRGHRGTTIRGCQHGLRHRLPPRLDLDRADRVLRDREHPQPAPGRS
jgi:hypothetical protein